LNTNVPSYMISDCH